MSSDTSQTNDSSRQTSHNNPSDLGYLRAAVLLTADCLGTGILALPQAIAVLGRGPGIFFLVLQLPINLYAGTILAHAATFVEEQLVTSNSCVPSQEELVEKSAQSFASKIPIGSDEKDQEEPKDGNALPNSKPNPASAASAKRTVKAARYESIQLDSSPPEVFQDEEIIIPHDVSTADFVNMNQSLFPHSPSMTTFVTSIYYTNIFLVLGDYILVQSHAVSALAVGGNMCLPTAGIVACALMFLISQLRTMANLGKVASFVSLVALFGVVAICILSIENNDEARPPPESTWVAKFSAMASIGFAVGSQKLFLNIRHEMKDKSESPKSLAISLTFYVGVYVFICLVAGTSPPGFLFDAIPSDSIQQRIAGLLLWVHVAVSYAINSQAMCVSLERMYFQQSSTDAEWKRWMFLTACLAMSSYLVANAVPFFKDLISITGALTTVPLTLLLPSIYWAKSKSKPCLWPPSCSWYYMLLIFSILFMAMGLTGALSEIELDWVTHGPPFSCH